MRRGAVLAALVISSGCSTFLGGDDDEDCDFGGPLAEGEDGLAAIEELRDPFSGQCQEVAPPGGGDPCGAVDPGGRAPDIPRGLCYQLGCESLPEQQCFERADCRAAYIDDGLSLRYYDCWSTPQPDTSIEDPASCNQLDAISCSLYNNCAAIHDAGCELGADQCSDPEVGSFVGCMEEQPIVSP